MVAKEKVTKYFKCFNFAILVAIAVLFVPSVPAEAGSNLSTADAFSIGNTLNGSLSDKAVYYRFTLDRNACVKFSAKTSGHEETVSVYLHDAEGETLEGWSTGDENNWGYQTGSSKVALSAGTYYLELCKYYGPTAHYILETSFLATASDSVKIGGQANGYLNTAVPFEIGVQLTSISEAKNHLYDWDVCHYYRFIVSTPMTVKFEISGAFGDRMDNNFFYLYDSQGNMIQNLKLGSGTEFNQYNSEFALKTGTYYIGVTAVSRSEGYSIRTSSSVAVPRVKGVKVSSPSKGKLKVRWKKVKNASYEVRICRKKNFAGSKVYKKDVSNSAARSYTKKGLKKGKIFYAQVRAYRLIDGNKFYGSWSAKKSVRVKR